MFYHQSEVFLVFSKLVFICVVSKNVLNLLQNLATVVRRRQSILMPKLADFSRLDKAL